MLKKCIFTWEKVKTAMKKNDNSQKKKTSTGCDSGTANYQNGATTHLMQKKTRKKIKEVLWIKNLPEYIFCYPN